MAMLLMKAKAFILHLEDFDEQLVKLFQYTQYVKVARESTTGNEFSALWNMLSLQLHIFFLLQNKHGPFRFDGVFPPSKTG